jgi:epoxyqueuosine reductase
VASPMADGCGSCRRCIDGCPAGAIVAPGTVDARRCLAWLVQAPGVFPVEYRAALGDRLYGCDDCQEVCPPNHRVERAAGGAVGDSPWVDLIELLASTDDELLARHGRWYIAERHPRTLRRNALIVLGNTADGNVDAVVDALQQALRHDDEIVRAHAVWAASRLDRHDLLDVVVDDPSPMVLVELARVNR